MQNKKLSIKKIVNYLNDEEAEGGGLWLPNIQRPFVWHEDQITRLFDSIMREYPISTLLVWKTKEDVHSRKFIDNYKKDLKLVDFHIPTSTKTKTLVLDGQQRLQSLFIGLKGSYEKNELYFDVTSGQTAVAPDDIRFKFAFRNPENTVFPWIKFKNIIFNNQPTHKILKEIINQATNPLSDAEKELIEENIFRIHQEFINSENITYQELDSTDDSNPYAIDDIVEIFIRANSGGTKLSKSDLLFSLLTSSWHEADEQIQDLLTHLNQGGFGFDRDFVLKACLTMLDKGARYDVGKFRDGKTKEDIINKWSELTAAICAVRDTLISETYIRSDHAMPSYLALIPLIYFRYHFPKAYTKNQDISAYILRVLLSAAFSGNPDYLIDKLVNNIKEKQDFVLSEIYGIIRANGRNLEISPETILNQGYGSNNIHLIFNLWYKQFNYTPAFNGNYPQIDHIFPQSALKKIKMANPSTGRNDVMRYPASVRNQIANCMLLTAEENGAGNKTDTLPEKWFSREHERFQSDEEYHDYLAMHLIPDNPELWKLENYDAFIEARKKLILEKFSDFLLQNKL